MSFFNEIKELTEAQVLDNKIHTYLSHTMYNRFNPKIERGGKIFEEELNEIVGQMHKAIKTIKPDMKVGWVKKLAFDYIVNEWGMHGHFEGAPVRKEQPVKPAYKKHNVNTEPKKPTMTSLEALAQKFNKR